MKYLPEGRLRVHPEVIEKFNELVRHHFHASRRGKDAAEIREAMRAQDAREQAALLTGKCEIETKTVHERGCYSRLGDLFYHMPCDCTPTTEVVFKAAKKIDNTAYTSFASYRMFFNEGGK